MNFIDIFKKNDHLGTLHTLKRGQIIYHEGDSPEQVFIIKKGLVGLFYISETGKETFLRVFGENSILGHRSILAEEKYHGTSVCLSPVDIISVSKESFHLELGINKEFRNYLLKKISVDLGHAEMRLSGLQDKTAPKRISETLIYLKLKHPKQVWTRKEIAEYSGSTFETVARVMSHLEKIGAIKIQGRDFDIMSKDLLLNHE